MNGNFGVTATGFIPKQLSDIESQIQTALQGDFGANYTLQSQTPDGQLVNRFSQQMADAWQAIEQAVNGFYPQTASGPNLDLANSLTNVPRIKATATVVNGALVQGVPGTGVPANFTIYPTSNPSLLFQVYAATTIGGGGTISASFVCETTGPNAIPADTIWAISTPVSGITGVTNPTAGQTGTNAELDSAYRVRAAQYRNRPGTATMNGIIAAVTATPNVSQVWGYANTGDTVNSYGDLPHSVHLVVSGGADQDVANAIYAAVGGGINTNGSTTVDVTTSQNQIIPIHFDRIENIPVYVVVNVNPNTAPAQGPVYPTNGDVLIQQAIVAYALTQYQPGQTVVQTGLFTPVNTVPGVADAESLEIFIGLAPNPAGTANIPMAINQLASFTAGNITVNS
jgi:uncharacterized phage protein gp47/JayE